uniref:DNA pilot protein n=1 Tax=Dulem virus 84 TaxID=3145795 RepID=A0AAU8BC92_9VIRU
MVIGVDDAIILAGIAAAGAGASYFGTQSTNKANQAMNVGQMAYQWGVDQWQSAKAVDMMREQYGLNALEAAKARDWSAWQSDIARNWTANMSSTAYQRAMQDLRAAGLNPILAYQQGGASTPPASIPAATSASVSGSVPAAHGAPAVHRMENALGPAVATALQGAQVVMGVQQAASQIDQTQAMTALAGAQQRQAETQAALNSATAITEAERAGLVGSQRASEAMMPALRSAQTGAASAQAALAAEQRVSETERQSLMREQGREAGSRANLARQQEHNLRTYGPPGPVSSTVGGISQIWNSIRESLR